MPEPNTGTQPDSVGFILAKDLIMQMAVMNRNMEALVTRLDAYMGLVATRLGPTISSADESVNSLAVELQIWGKAIEVLDEKRNIENKRLTMGDLVDAYLDGRELWEKENPDDAEASGQ
jgi:hypothetical protein